MRGEVRDVPREAGMCLAFVRVVVQHALGISYDEFYSHGIRVESVAQGRPWWARDMERGLRDGAGWAVDGERYGKGNRYIRTDVARPGDLLFKWDTAVNRTGEFVGHVGICLGGVLIENISPNYRPNSARLARNRNVSLTPVGEWDATTIIRWRE